MLYNLVLVDDEDWILAGIQNAIKWEEIGFRIAGTYTNGREAGEAMKNQPPEAILTDIKMPIQDGISLVRELREAGFSQIEVVFLSGYDDFELAQSSLRLGAVDYVLKPSAPEQIIEVFTRIKKRLDERRINDEKQKADAELVMAGMKVFKDAVYNSIMSGNRSLYDKLLELYAEFVERERGCSFSVVSVALRSTVEEQPPSEEEVQGIACLNELARELEEVRKYRLRLLENQFSFSFVFSGSDEAEIDAAMEDLRRKLRKQTGKELLCSRIRIYKEFGMIRKAYETSLESLFSLDMPASVQHLYRTLGNDIVLKAAVEDRDQQIVLWSLKNWMLKIDKTEAKYRLRLMKRLVYSLGIYFMRHGIASRTVANLYEPLKAGDYQGGKEAVISFVKSELLQENKGGGKNANLCKEVSKYISENYTDDITLNELADRFYISPNYLGTLFKKNLGIGVREYQTTIRLEQADALIASRKFKLYQVAQMVGYPNYEYFRKIYSKYKGKNPSE